MPSLPGALPGALPGIPRALAARHPARAPQKKRPSTRQRRNERKKPTRERRLQKKPPRRNRSKRPSGRRLKGPEPKKPPSAKQRRKRRRKRRRPEGGIRCVFSGDDVAAGSVLSSIPISTCETRHWKPTLAASPFATRVKYCSPYKLCLLKLIFWHLHNLGPHPMKGPQYSSLVRLAYARFILLP